MFKINGERFLTSIEAARELGVQRQTVYEWSERGLIPMTRHPFNGYRLFRERDIEEAVSKISAGTSPEKETYKYA